MKYICRKCGGINTKVEGDLNNKNSRTICLNTRCNYSGPLEDFIVLPNVMVCKDCNKELTEPEAANSLVVGPLGVLNLSNIYCNECLQKRKTDLN